MSSSTYRKRCRKNLPKPDKRRIAKHYGADTSKCMACGVKTTLIDRAHILSLQFEGTNELDNFNLLCKTCHAESEYLWDNEYDLWLELKREFYSKGALSSHFTNDSICRFLILDRLIRDGKQLTKLSFPKELPKIGTFEGFPMRSFMLAINEDLFEKEGME